MDKKILVVDDDDSFRELMMNHLWKKGYEVEGAQDGQEAIQLLRSTEEYAVLVTDMMMPGIGGLELLRIAKKMSDDIEVIVITASGSLEAAISALREDGAFDFLTKPLDMMAELSIAVDRALRYRDLRMEKKQLRARQAQQVDRVQAVVSLVREDVIAVDSSGCLELANASARKYLKRFEKGAPILDLLPDQLVGVVSSWKVRVGSEAARVFMYLKGFGVKEIQFSSMCEAAGGEAGWVMTLRDRDCSMSHEQYLESLLAGLDQAVECHQSLIGTISDLADICGLRTTEARKVLGSVALQLRRMDQLFHKLRSSMDLSFHSPGDHENRVFAAGPVVDLAVLSRDEMSLANSNMRWEIPGEIPYVRGDKELLRSAVDTFQAIASPNGSIPQLMTTITASAIEGRIWLELENRTQQHAASTIFNGEPLKERLLVQIVVDRMGGQYWQYIHEKRALAAIVLPAAAGSRKRIVGGG